jgi:hypothetical protein
MSNGQKSLKAAKAISVSAIRTAELISNTRPDARWPYSPTSSVSSAEPRSVVVAITPVSKAP